MEKNEKWFWTPLPPLGGAAGGLASKIFRGIDQLDTADLLAREVIQNSWDAARKLRSQEKRNDLPFEMKFRFVSLTGKEKENFVSNFGLSEILNQSANMKKRTQEKAVSAYKSITNKSEPLRLLFCEDYGAHGLYGGIDKPSKSVLFRALYMFGDTDKGDDQGSGGSYGFGKSAFIRGSAIQTVLAYSSFKKFEEDNVTRRFVGFSYWDNFNINDHYFDGRAIFGNSQKSPGTPFEDKLADDWAQKAQFDKRENVPLEALGTSLALISPLITSGELINAIEKWWWPAIVDKKMQVRVIDESGASHFPRPLKNEFVRPFLRTYSIAKGEAKPSETNKEMLVSQGWRETNGLRLGEYALRLMDEDESNQESQEIETHYPTVALMRNPQMVVHYKSFERRRVPVRGIFIASDEADSYLKLSEPAQHDHWDTKPAPDANEKEHKAAIIARSVYDQLSKGLSKFIDEVSPPNPRDKQVLSLFADLMSGLISGKKVGPKKAPPASKMPFVIQFSEQAKPQDAGNGLIETKAEIEIKLGPNATKEAYPVKISFEFNIMEDGEEKGDLWDTDFEVLTSKSGFTKEQQCLRGTLTKDMIIRVKVLTKPYDPNWTGLLKPKVELDEADKAKAK